VDEENFDQMKAVYTACIDEPGIKSAGVKPLLAVLQDVARPLSGSATGTGNSSSITMKDAEAISKTISYLQKLGIDTLVSVDTSYETMNGSLPTSWVTRPEVCMI
jgi:hypothetical protein